MTWVATAIVGGTIGGALISSSGAQSAASTQAGAAENAQGISENEFNTITQQNQPYMNSGYGALSQLDYLLGVTPQSNGSQTSGNTSSLASAYSGTGQGYNPASGASSVPWGNPYSTGGSGGALPATASDVSSMQGQGWSPTVSGASGGAVTPQNSTGQASTAGGFGSLLTPFTADYMKQYSPAYQFQLQQGQQGVLNQDASSQGALSGSALKDLIGYNQNMANTAYNNAFNQYQTQQGNTYSRLSGVAQLGQASANNTGQQGTALAGQAAQSATNVGTALAAGTVGSANALSSGVSNLGSLYALYGGGGASSASVGASDPYD